MKINFLLFLFIILASSVFGQTPQKQEPKRTRFDPPTEINGFKVRYATLSKGKYQEIFSNDTIQQIGSVLFNRVTGEVVGEVIKDSLYFPADVVSRWWSIDPLAEKFPEQSPYVFSNNNPILFIDPDGMAAIPYDDYFNSKGQYLGTDNAKTNNIRVVSGAVPSNFYSKGGMVNAQVGQKTGVLLSDLTFRTAESRALLSNIGLIMVGKLAIMV